MKSKIGLQLLHIRLLKSEVTRIDRALEEPRKLKGYSLKVGLEFEGRLYISPPNQSPPRWLKFVETGIAEHIRELTNRTNAAVLLIKRDNRVFAITFGHGRHLIKPTTLVPDFGLRTALNGLKHNSLRSLDTFTFEEQTVHTRTQASRGSGIEVFGLDIGRDILRAVTGTPLPEVSFQNLSGSESTLAVSTRVDFPRLGKLCSQLLSLYNRRSYRENFAWVDNVKRVRDISLIERLDQALLQDLRRKDDCKSYISPPEPIDWAHLDGFACSRRRNTIEVDLDISNYREVTDLQNLEVDNLKSDKVFIYRDGIGQPSDAWQIYKCLQYEVSLTGGQFLLTNGTWFQVNRAFADEVRTSLMALPVANISLPSVRRRSNGKLEHEGDYNTRVQSEQPTMALLDKKIVRCRATSSGIEPCDLLSRNRDMIHVKHVKGGSSSLSHLFAQARISGEALLSDEDFRKGVRVILRQERESWQNRIPVGRPVASEFQIVLAILGVANRHPGSALPFFSQLNLVRSVESLMSWGYRVGIIGIRIQS